MPCRARGPKARAKRTTGDPGASRRGPPVALEFRRGPLRTWRESPRATPWRARPIARTLPSIIPQHSYTRLTERCHLRRRPRSLARLAGARYPCPCQVRGQTPGHRRRCTSRALRRTARVRRRGRPVRVRRRRANPAAGKQFGGMWAQRAAGTVWMRVGISWPGNEDFRVADWGFR